MGPFVSLLGRINNLKGQAQMWDATSNNKVINLFLSTESAVDRNYNDVMLPIEYVRY